MLGINLYNLRKSNSMNQEDLAKELNVSRQAISKWERDESAPDLEKLMMMAKLFNVTVDELLEGTFDLENYEPRQNSQLSILSIENQKMVALGLMIISSISALLTLFGTMTMYRFSVEGIAPNFTATGFLSMFLKDFRVFIILIVISSAVLLISSISIYVAFKAEVFNKKVRFTTILFGIILALFGQTLLGISYVLLGVFMTPNNEELDLHNIRNITIYSLLGYIVIGILFYTVGGALMPSTDMFPQSMIGGF